MHDLLELIIHHPRTSAGVGVASLAELIVLVCKAVM